MKLSGKMTAQEWKDLLCYLEARGVYLITFPTTDDNGLFTAFKYALVEYGGQFFYIESPYWEFTVCKYNKVSPYERQQSGYPCKMESAEQLLEYMKTQTKDKPLRGTHKQRIFLIELYGIRGGETDLWRLKNMLAGNREKAVLADLERITTIRNTNDYHVLRFHSTGGNWFDYETKSRRITG